MSDLRVDDRVTLPAAELELQFSRSGGPGGQHVNTTDTRARLRWAMGRSRALSQAAKDRLTAARPGWVTTEGDVVITGDRYRSRQQNVDDVRERLRQAVYAALRPPRPRKATKPTRASKQRRVKGKKKRGETKKLRGKVSRDGW